nr:MAG TPA: hypothetical protein [Caudoviricetes sp.]
MSNVISCVAPCSLILALILPQYSFTYGLFCIPFLVSLSSPEIML